VTASHSFSTSIAAPATREGKSITGMVAVGTLSRNGAPENEAIINKWKVGRVEEILNQEQDQSFLNKQDPWELFSSMMNQHCIYS
jgi:hypothetical protein